MASQRHQDKEEFFRALYSLDDMSDSDKGSTTISGDKPQEPSSSKSSHRDRTTHLARSPANPVLHKATTATRATTASSRSPSAPNSISKAQRSVKQAKPGAMPLATSANSTMPSQIKQSSRVPFEMRFFTGSTFFFIPNRGLTALRKGQIAAAKDYGAKVAQILDNSVTHIIADSKWEICHIMKELPDGRRPKDVPIVTELWVVDCVVRRALQDYDQLRFFVKGTKSASSCVPDNDVDNKNEARILSDLCPRSLLATSDGLTDRTDVAAQRLNNDSAQAEQPAISHPRETEDDGRLTEVDGLDIVQREVDHKNVGSKEDLVQNDPSFKFEGDYVFDTSSLSSPGSSFSCANKNERDQASNNPNCATIQCLQELANIYYLNRNDQFRARAFKMAATTLGKQKVLIATKEDAMKLSSIGTSIAEKIEEIVRNGRLARLDEVTSDSRQRIVNLFTGIYQVGHAQASAWVAAGYTSLAQLLEHGNLTANQKSGIEHYQDFQARIPRAEVTQHGLVVEQALKSIDPELLMIIGGSYRRGSPDSGDIDILITKKYANMEQIRTVILKSLIPRLKTQGFIVGELASGHASQSVDSSKWMGACLLPGSKIWRRLDLLFVPWDELGAALIYWTGNDIFNRSLRLLASRRAMRLNQHGLYKDVLRGKNCTKLTKGELVESHSEKKIFEHLNVAYRPPEHRNP